MEVKENEILAGEEKNIVIGVKLTFTNTPMLTSKVPKKPIRKSKDPRVFRKKWRGFKLWVEEVKLVIRMPPKIANQMENIFHKISSNLGENLQRFSRKKERNFGLKIQKEESGEFLVNSENTVFATLTLPFKRTIGDIFQRVSG
jgi:hypothetical protein